MAFQVTGKIRSIGAVEQKSETFKSRKFVLTTELDTKYPQNIEFQVVNDKCDSLNAYAINSDVTVSFNLRGREWTSPQGEIKCFNTLDAWRVEAAQAQGAPAAQAPNQNQNFVPQNQTPVQFSNPDSGDLPF